MTHEPNYDARGHDTLELIDGLVPSVAAVVDDVVI